MKVFLKHTSRLSVLVYLALIISIGFFFSGTNFFLVAKDVKAIKEKKETKKKVIKKYTAKEEEHYIEIFKKAYFLLRRAYVDESKVDAEKLVQAAIQGMIKSLDDPFTAYLSGGGRKNFIDSINNKFVGIGIYVKPHTNGIEVLGVIKGGPAWEVGLQPKDIILEVGGMSLKGSSLEDGRNYILGKKNSVVKLKIERKINEKVKLITVNVERRSVNSKTVFNRIIEGRKVSSDNQGVKLGYIKINIFGMTTGEEFKESLDFTKQQLALGDPNLKRGIVIDLRDNPGGLLDVVANMVNYFVTKGTIVSTKNRNKKAIARKADRSVAIPKFLPLIVMINEHSASASEIMSGALKDYKRALIIGRNSYGKFSVQRIFDVEPNKSSIKMTIAKYYLPSGGSFSKVGITPNVVVTNTRSSEVVQAFYESEVDLKVEDRVVRDDPMLMEAIRVLSTGDYKKLLIKNN